MKLAFSVSAVKNAGFGFSELMRKRLTTLVSAGMVASAAPAWTQISNNVDYRAMRLTAEAKMRESMFDPGSAQFNWPTGFKYGTFSTPLNQVSETPPASGLVACGRVNAKNRLGGYVGERTFVVVMSSDGKDVKYSSIDDGTFPFIQIECGKWQFPEAPKSMFAEPTAAKVNIHTSVADELEKLAKLRRTGVITQAEFNLQKRKLLSGD